MKTGREDYDKALASVKEIFGEDEPVFIIRAKDPDAVGYLSSIAAHKNMGPSNWKLVNSIYCQIDAMEKWQKENGTNKISDYEPEVTKLSKRVLELKQARPDLFNEDGDFIG